MTFNKASVILMYINIMSLPVICFKLESWPSKYFIFCWFAFWTIQAILTARIHIKKKRRVQDSKAFDEVKKYITEDNVAEVLKRFTGIKIGAKNNDENYK
jgi:hypothetical protein